MKCSEAQELLSQFVDDALDPSSMKRVEEHLAACKECSAELEALRAYLKEMQSMERLQAPPAFLRQVHERIGSRSSTKRFFEKFLFPLHIKLPVGLAGALAIVLLLLMVHPGFKPEKERQIAPLISEAPPAPKHEEDRARIALQKESHEEKGTPQTVQPSAMSEEERPIQLTLLIKPALQSRETRETGAMKMKTGPPPGSSAPVPQTELKRRAHTALPQETKPAAPAMSAPRGAMPEPDFEKPGRERTSQDKPSPIAGEGALSRDERPGKAPLGDSKAVGKGDFKDASGFERALSEVRKSVLAAGGSILATEYEEQQQLPRSITVQIPIQEYPLVLRRLQLIGQFKEAPPAELEGTKQGFLRLNIRLVSKPAE